MTPINSYSLEKSAFGRHFQKAQLTQFVMFLFLTVTILISLFFWNQISKYSYLSEDELIQYIQANNLLSYIIMLLILFLGIGILGLFSSILSIKYIIALEKVSRITASRFLHNIFLIQTVIHIYWFFALFLIDANNSRSIALIILISNCLHILYYLQMKKWVKDFPYQGVNLNIEDSFQQFICLRQLLALISIALLVLTLISNSAPLWKYLLLSTIGSTMTGISWRIGIQIVEIFT
ncbi:hypothetical protein [Candidatus Harpocratesius sp.]